MYPGNQGNQAQGTPPSRANQQWQPPQQQMYQYNQPQNLQPGGQPHPQYVQPPVQQSPPSVQPVQQPVQPTGQPATERRSEIPDRKKESGSTLEKVLVVLTAVLAVLAAVTSYYASDYGGQATNERNESIKATSNSNTEYVIATNTIDSDYSTLIQALILRQEANYASIYAGWALAEYESSQSLVEEYVNLGDTLNAGVYADKAQRAYERYQEQTNLSDDKYEQANILVNTTIAVSLHGLHIVNEAGLWEPDIQMMSNRLTDDLDIADNIVQSHNTNATTLDGQADAYTTASIMLAVGIVILGTAMIPESRILKFILMGVVAMMLVLALVFIIAA